MKVYATFDKIGLPLGYFPDDWHGPRMRPIFGELIMIPVFQELVPTEDEPEPEPIYVGDIPDPKVHPNPPVIGNEPNPETTIPADAIEISEAQYVEFLNNEGRRRWDGTKVVPYEPPAPPLPPIVLSADVLFFERMTDAEYDALDDNVRSRESARVYRGWAAAASFTEGTDLWALLVKHLDEIGTTSDRRAELLTRP